MAPLLLSHYDIAAALWQKVAALAGRSVVQARDVFDLHILIPQQQAGSIWGLQLGEDRISSYAVVPYLQACFASFSLSLRQNLTLQFLIPACFKPEFSFASI